jgi:hypothetical protein
MLMQKSFFALYDYGKQIRNGEMELKEAEKKSKKDCDEFCKSLRIRGIRYTRSCTEQCR